VAARIAALRAEGVTLAVVDALGDDDLRTLARAAQPLPLVVAGSGLAIGIPALHGLQPGTRAALLPAAGGARAVVSGSCSAATNAQVAVFLAAVGPGVAVDPLRPAAGHDLAAEALAWALPRLDEAPLLVYATAKPDAVRTVQQQLGVERAGALVEETLARIACGLVQAGVGRLIVAGGETSGACVQALGITPASDRPPDRPRSALVPCGDAGARRRAASRVEVGQLWQHRLLRPCLQGAALRPGGRR
jgi:uncharacterized protein YgbK (DUF1537 family)